MPKVKRKLTPAQKRAKKLEKAERQKKYQWIFINGKQVRIKREPPVEDINIDVDEFILNNHDLVWFDQDGMWEFIETQESISNIGKE